MLGPPFGVRALILLAVLFLGMQAKAQQAAYDPQFLLSADPDTLVLAYSETPDLIANVDSTPRIRIYADGRVLVHYPRYMKRAGEYETYLSRGQLLKLLRDVAVVIDLDTDAAELAKERSRIKRFNETGVVTHRWDLVLEQFDLNLDGYRPHPGAKERKISQSVQWRDIDADAEQHPSVRELVALKQARKAIRGILDSTDLEKLP